MITLQITVQFNRSMMGSKSTIQEALNEDRTLPIENLLKKFDTEGGVNSFWKPVRLTSKGLALRVYQTLYAEVQNGIFINRQKEGHVADCFTDKSICS
ncbi:MAG: hypothetical protein K2W92_07360 [Alphaproteobacteria bacterium]|nr:hypothetical protein [Alphaproteobacteria bacterium]